MVKKLRLRRASSSDVAKVFQLSNDPVVRSKSIHQKPIVWESHVDWFQKALVDSSLKFYIVESEEGEFIGQVRFKKEEDFWITSISVCSDFRGQGLGSLMLQVALEQMIGHVVIAYIRENNVPSQRIFTKAGFVFQNTKEIEGEIYKLYRYER